MLSPESTVNKLSVAAPAAGVVSASPRSSRTRSEMNGKRMIEPGLSHAQPTTPARRTGRRAVSSTIITSPARIPANRKKRMIPGKRKREP